MIKWIYFSKFLKLFLFGCWISCIMVLGNSVSAFDSYWFIQVWWNYIESNVDSQFSNAVLKRWKLLWQYIWYTKPMFVLDNDSFVFWNWNKPYLFDNFTYNCTHSSHPTLIQWYINQMVSCWEITTTWWDFWSSCWAGVDYNEQLVSNFLSKVQPWDWFFYQYSYSPEWYCRWFGYVFDICYSSSELHQTLCFEVNHSAEWSAWGSNPFYWLWENLNFSSDTTFGSINLSVLGNPPWWWTSTPDFVSSTGVWCVPVSQILNWFDSKYTTWYCYVPVNESWTVTNYFIEDIFSWYSQFQDMFSNYNAYCHAPYTEQYCNEMMWNNIIWKSLIAKLITSPYEFNLKDLWNYCHYTTLPLNATTCTLQSWWVAEPLTPDELLDAINSQPSSLVVPSENTIVSNVLWTWATDLSNINIVDTLNWLYSRFTSFFTEQSWYWWTLPTYIVTFLLVIFLFKLFKK